MPCRGRPPWRCAPREGLGTAPVRVQAQGVTRVSRGCDHGVTRVSDGVTTVPSAVAPSQCWRAGSRQRPVSARGADATPLAGGFRQSKTASNSPRAGNCSPLALDGRGRMVVELCPLVPTVPHDRRPRPLAPHRPPGRPDPGGTRPLPPAARRRPTAAGRPHPSESAGRAAGAGWGGHPRTSRATPRHTATLKRRDVYGKRWVLYGKRWEPPGTRRLAQRAAPRPPSARGKPLRL
jgi:hypothetical protein